MLDNDSDRLPPAVRRIGINLRMAGWASVWSQGILAIVSTLVLIFASAVLNFGSTPTATVTRDNPGAGVGFFFAVIGLLLLYAGACWAFFYTRLSRKLRAVDGRDRPKPSDVIRATKIGIMLNLAGMLLSLLGSGAWTGSLIGKTFFQGNQPLAFQYATQTIQAGDVWVVQAIFLILLAHYTGLLASLVLVQTMGRQ
ncbi:MAG: DUF3611 family protein [Leptolyngbyaceae bacterium]|nr:DUF3611 family protein [Leptolyngbyaceae bacterium]